MATTSTTKTQSSSFPYTVDDEPTEDWTVQQVLQWWLLRAQDESDAEYDRIVSKLNDQLTMGKNSLWQAHEDVSNILNNKLPVSSSSLSNGLENSNPQHQYQQQEQQQHSKQQNHTTMNFKFPAGTVASAAAAASGPTTSSSLEDSDHRGGEVFNNPDTIHIQIVAGEYEGSTFDLQPKGRVACYVGRSQGKKFKDRGVSLPKDLEVSTTHGKFELIRGKFYYTDTGSTNGSHINGMEIDSSQAFEVRDGMQITCGQTIMLITLTVGSSSSSS